MPSINDLKRNSVNKPNNTVPESDDIVLDMTSTKSINESMQHNEAVYNNRPKGKTIVNAPNYITKPDGTRVNLPPKRVAAANNATGDRVAFDLTKMPKEKDPHEEDIHKSITDDILSGKNPILYDYMKEKAAEMSQWVEEKEDERQLKIANGEIKDDGSDELTIDLTAPTEIDFGDEDNKVEENNTDNLSFENYEHETTDSSNETYASVNDDDLFLDDEVNTEESNNMNEEEEVLEIVDDIPEDNSNDDIQELIENSTKDNFIDSNDHDTAVVDDINEVETPVEVDAEPEVDTSVSAEDIEVQEVKGLEREEFSVETDSEEKKNDDEIDEATRNIIEQANKVLKPAAKKLDLSSFTVVKKPGNINRFFNQKPVNVAKWVLRTKKVCIHMKASQGAELEELRVLMQEADTASDFIRMYRIIYDHIVSPKPNTFEAWCKSTYTADLDDYFFCFFQANYKDSNYIPYDCSNAFDAEKNPNGCKPGSFLSDNLPIMNMVKFGSDKDKEEFKQIYKSDTFDNEDGLYPAERIPFSNNVAIDFIENTLYSYIEAQSVRNNNAFLTKYSGTIALAPNISNIYAIDISNNTLIPVEYKIYENSNSNTYKSKIQKYDSVLKTLTPDEFSTLISYVNTFTAEHKNAIDMKYIRPEAICPHCGAKIEAQDTTGQSLVFYRYQLGQLVNISTK